MLIQKDLSRQAVKTVQYTSTLVGRQLPAPYDDTSRPVLMFFWRQWHGKYLVPEQEDTSCKVIAKARCKHGAKSRQPQAVGTGYSNQLAQPCRAPKLPAAITEFQASPFSFLLFRICTSFFFTISQTKEGGGGVLPQTNTPTKCGVYFLRFVELCQATQPHPNISHATLQSAFCRQKLRIMTREERADSYQK